ncbi:MAG TPA: glutamine-hydrolyzing carbamoyl-phosphate synthase small subunit [Actinomycetota bacterium]|jgi:carbamoyl-phosphate synthase small subunit|nr:glutamine-hydrolyzing carbamoyl-phosphate synthase small subunit [Actinomycetota bacterium]
MLALEDGTVFKGSAFGATGTVTGEVCFNTGMSGYQEILTDPSYHGQIVTMTAPQIGNTGVNPHDDQSARVWAEGLVVRDLSRTFSSWRAAGSLDDYLEERSIPGIADIDTRRLTRHIRTHGAMRGAIASDGCGPDELVDRSRAARSLVGRDLAAEVTTETAYVRDWEDLGVRRATGFAAGMEGDSRSNGSSREPVLSIAALDFGIKRNILDLLVASGSRVTVLPATTAATDILNGGYDGVFLSNGPGDPEPVRYGIATLRTLLGRVPIFGICLGHQLLALAAGGRTFKLPFGHRGANHPVRWLLSNSNQVEITCQNHGFAVDRASLDATPARLSHVNLNDGTVEGLLIEGAAFSVQYHPEAGPGPHDSRYLFRQFRELIATFEPADLALGVPA